MSQFKLNAALAHAAYIALCAGVSDIVVANGDKSAGWLVNIEFITGGINLVYSATKRPDRTALTEVVPINGELLLDVRQCPKAMREAMAFASGLESPRVSFGLKQIS